MIKFYRLKFSVANGIQKVNVSVMCDSAMHIFSFLQVFCIYMTSELSENNLRYKETAERINYQQNVIYAHTQTHTSI